MQGKDVKLMEEFPQYYLTLFRAVADAVEALDNQNYGQARQILIAAMQKAEKLILEQPD